VAFQANYIMQVMERRSGTREKEKPKTEAVPERKLDEFETAALETLKKGRDFVIDEKPGKLRVIGAIRASSDCLSCHTSCKEHDLLGAFTYVLTPRFSGGLSTMTAEEIRLRAQQRLATLQKAVVQDSPQF